MATGSQLPIDREASALETAQGIFGQGVEAPMAFPSRDLHASNIGDLCGAANHPAWGAAA